ncbi:type II toxin-antitoxin system prevent-host-death family antitoxin [Pseudomonas baltica]|uniref:type II toxin-antitoxin system Phd/YefM family antitoxin n=1 Tax=Pseudomonas baltica TaxID=2762576 RepID=UPI0028A1F052|nr:type II toxin-antitoxin system prevent-host-death family antitoxin [Pseudomonas baltica]
MTNVATVNISTAKTHLPRLAQEAARGSEIIITKNGHPIAKLVAFEDSASSLPRIGFGLAHAAATDAMAAKGFDADI